MNREDTIFGDDWPYTKAKSALLRSAAVVMREQGPRAATLKNIAGKTGVTEPAIFRHFDGVDGLFESLYLVTELYYGLFVSCLERAGGSGLDKLEAAFAGIADALDDDGDFAYLLAYPDPVFRQYDKLRAGVAERNAALRSAVAALAGEAKAAGQLAPSAEPEAVAEAVLGAFGRSLAAWAADAVDPRQSVGRSIGGVCAFARKTGQKPKPAAKPELRLAAVRAAAEKPAEPKAAPKKPATQKAAKAEKKASAAKPAAKTTAKPSPKAEKPSVKAAKPVAKAAKPVAKAPAKAEKPASKAPTAKKPAAAKPAAEPKKTKKK